MEKRFQIVTDSSCDLPQALADELDLAVLPLHVLIGEHTYANYLDGREIGFREFYDKLRDGERATTSAVNVSEFTAVMEEKLKAGLDILFIGFSSGLSTTYQSGAIACSELREKYPERKLIAIDSLCASLGEGLLLYLAAKKQQSGATMDEVADYVRETIPHLCHWFTVNDLMFLKRGGRVDAATALVGTVLQIKPVMHTDDAGTLKNVTKARGRKAALKALAQKLADTAINPAEQTVFICHGDCIEDAEYTAEQIRALTPVKDIIINYVGPGIGKCLRVGGPYSAIDLYDGTRARRLDEPTRTTDFIICVFYEFLPSESGIHAHEQYHVDIGDDVLEHHDGGGGIEGDCRLHTGIADGLYHTVKMCTCLDMYVHDGRSAVAHGTDKFLRVHYHHVHVEGLVGDTAHSLDHREAERYIGHKHAVHHVAVHILRVRAVDYIDRRGQVGKVG